MENRSLLHSPAVRVPLWVTSCLTLLMFVAWMLATTTIVYDYARVPDRMGAYERVTRGMHEVEVLVLLGPAEDGKRVRPGRSSSLTWTLNQYEYGVIQFDERGFVEYVFCPEPYGKRFP